MLQPGGQLVEQSPLSHQDGKEHREEDQGSKAHCRHDGNVLLPPFFPLLVPQSQVDGTACEVATVPAQGQVACQVKGFRLPKIAPPTEAIEL